MFSSVIFMWTRILFTLFTFPQMVLNRGKVFLDKGSSISSDLERCSLQTGTEENNSNTSQSKDAVEVLCVSQSMKNDTQTFLLSLFCK